MVNELSKAAKKAVSSSMSEIGVTGLKREAGVISEEFLQVLQGNKALGIYQEMRENDPTVGAILFALDQLMRQVEWRVTPASGDKADAEAAEFVESCMHDMSHTWADMISEIMSMLVFGWSYHEIIYKKRGGPDSKDVKQKSKFNDGKIGWRKIPIRSQDTRKEWEFDDQGGVKSLVQSAPPDYKEVKIPIEKALLFRTQSYKNNPEGRSVLRNAYRPWFFKKKIEEIEAIGVERDLAGLPIAYVDARIMKDDASDEDKQFLEQIKQIVINIRRDVQEGIILPAAWDDNGHRLYELQLLNSGGTRQFDTTNIISRLDQRIALTVLADFIFLGHDSTGSFALASSRTNLFTLAMHAILMSIAEVFNRIAIPRLFSLNSMNVENYPEIVPGEVATPDMNELSGAITRLTQAGMPMFPDERLEEHLRQLMKLPPKKLSTEEEQQQEQMAQMPGPAGGGGLPQNMLSQMDRFRQASRRPQQQGGTPPGTSNEPG